MCRGDVSKRNWKDVMNDSKKSLKVLLVVGNTASVSTTRVVVEATAAVLREKGCQVDLFDYASEPLPLFNVESSFQGEAYRDLKSRVTRADVLVIGSPDYHGSMSSAAKNFLDHFWKEFAGKLFASVVGSYEKGLTVHDQIRTVARQCYAWSLPYGVSFHEKHDLEEGAQVTSTCQERLEMLAADVVAYGRVIAEQRLADLGGEGPGFMAHYR